MTFLGTAPIRILRFVDLESGVVRYVSLGCSAEPMGDPSALVPDPTAPRAELSLVLRGGVDGVVRALAVLAAAPAVEGLVLSEGALIDLGEPLWPGAAFTAVVLRAPEIPDVELPGDRLGPEHPDGDHVGPRRDGAGTVLGHCRTRCPR